MSGGLTLFCDGAFFAGAGVMRTVAKECSSVRNGPTLRYAFAGPPVTTFYTKWCDR